MKDELKRGLILMLLVIMSNFSGVGIYFIGTSNGWFENVIFAQE